MNLNRFKEINLFNAGTSFFKQLNIRLNSSSTSSLPLKDILKDKFKSQGIFNKVTETYFLGLVDRSVFDDNLSLFEDKKISYEQADKKIHADYEGMMIFAVQIKKIALPTRTQLSDLTRAFNRASKSLPVVVLFQYNDFLTLATSERTKYKQTWREGEKIGKISLLKDIDILNPHTGHIKILDDLILKPDVRDFNGLYLQWREVFDVQLLNRNFYTELSTWYFWALQNVEFPDDTEKNAEIRNASSVIRLLTRLIFVWFIKEKGLIPDKLFDKSKLDNTLNYKDNNDNSFYKAVLQNLFFATLNQEQSKRAFRRNGQNYNITNLYRYKKLFKIDEIKILGLFKNIPFLNGGLFECLDKPHPTKKGSHGGDVIIRIDGFSDRDDNVLKVPDYLFFAEERDIDLNEVFDTKNKKYKVKGLINLLNKYKFTIAENTPIEEEIALDPELLGKVFENLLASYNPETKTTARKQTGSFYTPREIVDYMVDESLKASLSNLVSKKIDGVSEEDIQTGLEILFAYTEEKHAFTETEVSKVIEAVSELKILDPACGSGAFPMGILHKLVFILNKLDEHNERWKELQKQRALKETEAAYNLGNKDERHQRLAEIEKAFDFNTSDYGRKLFLIENSIYGVDIQPIAVQIARLRFFISLIVDQDVDKTKENLGIIPLPNLETKFVAANTLIGVDKPDQGSFADLKTKDLENELLIIRHKHFNAKTQNTKRKYREEDKRTRYEIAQTLKKSGWPSDIAEMLAAWDPYDQNCFSDFFDMEWMFGIKDGFDIVIGNPPYVQIQKFSGKQEQKDWRSQKYKTYTRTGDIYCLFYEKGNMLLRNKGVLTFITSNKWMRANYGKLTRKYFAEKTNPLQIVDFGGYKVFESATVDTNILIFEKAKNKKSTTACKIKNDFVSDTNISKYVNNNSVTLNRLSEESWIIASNEEQRIKDKIEKIGTPLKDWDISIYRGVLTGYNKAFIIDGAKKDELIAADPKNAEIIKPVLRGRDIKRYKAEFADLWLINTHNGYFDEKSGKKIPPIKLTDYPVIKEHLDKYWKKIEKRQDKGVTPYNLRNCAYLGEFEKEKIIYPETTVRRSEFYYDKNALYLDKTCFFIAGEQLQFLTTLLASKAIKYYLENELRVLGKKSIQYSKQYIEKLPLPKFPPKFQTPFITLADTILAKKEKGEDTTTEENKIDIMVSKLYELTYSEVKIIDPEIEKIISKEKYNTKSIEEIAG